MNINFANTEKISKIMITFVMLSMMGLLAGGCSIIQRTRYPEPTSISVRNTSGLNISIVTIREASNSNDKHVRMGRISPVPRGATQVVRRPSSPPPFPERVIISWTDFHQRQYEREILLEKILNDPNTQTEYSLIFEILPSGRISVFKE